MTDVPVVLASTRLPVRPFVASLRTGPNVIHLATESGPGATIRVEVPEVWDAVRVETSLNVSVQAVKELALQALYPDAFPEEFVMKLHGAEVRDESLSLAQAGAMDGSIFLETYRRRRPVRA